MDQDAPARTPSPSPRGAAPWSPQADAAADAGGWRGLDGDAGLNEKRGRTRFLPAQVAMLERSFQESEALNVHKATRLSRAVGVEVRQVYVWYQNRRARRRQKDPDSGGADSAGQGAPAPQARARKAVPEQGGPAKRPRTRAQHHASLQDQAKNLLASIASRSPEDIEDARKWRSICTDLNALASALTALHSPGASQDRLARNGTSLASGASQSTSRDDPSLPVAVPCQGPEDEPRSRESDSELEQGRTAEPRCTAALLDLDLRLGLASEHEQGHCCAAGGAGTDPGVAAPCSAELSPCLRHLSDEASSRDTQQSSLQGHSSEAHPCSSATASSGALLTSPGTPEVHLKAEPIWVEWPK